MRQYLITLLGIVGLSCSPGGSDDDPNGFNPLSRATASAYVTQYTPASLAMAFPASLSSASSVNLQLQGGGGPTGTDMSGDQAQSYMMLKDTVGRVQQQIADLQRHLLEFDAAFEQIEGHCGGNLSSCEVPEGTACVVFTVEMAKSLEQTLGEQAMTAEELESLDSQINTEHCLPAMSVTTNPDDEEGLTFSVRMLLDEENSFGFAWSEDRSKVKSLQKFSTSFDGDMFGDNEGGGGTPPAEESHSGSSAFFYDSVAKTFTSRDTFRDHFAGMKITSKNTLQVDAIEGGEEINEVEIRGSFEMESSDFNFEHKFVAVASDEGGVIKNKAKDVQKIMDAITLSGNSKEGVHYFVVPTGTDPNDAEQVHLLNYGHIDGDGTNSPQVGFFHRHPPSDPSILALYVVNSPDEGKESFSDSGLSISSVSVEEHESRFYFEEMWGASGELLAFCFRDENSSDCIGASHGEVKGEYADELEQREDEPRPWRMEGVSLGDLLDSNDAPFEVFLAVRNLENVEPFSDEMHERILGFVFVQDVSDNGITGLDNFVVEYFGDPARAERVELYVLDHDSFTNNRPRLKKISGKITR